jgi:hypothetical protein
MNINVKSLKESMNIEEDSASSSKAWESRNKLPMRKPQGQQPIVNNRGLEKPSGIDKDRGIVTNDEGEEKNLEDFRFTQETLNGIIKKHR